MSYKSDCELLGLDPDIDLYDPDVIKEHFRERAMKLHPDIEGGDRERFQATRDASDRLRRDAMKRWSTCPDCRGNGRNVQKSGWRSLEQTCRRCNGSGSRIPAIT